jgi:hypothetical protein
MQDDDDAFYITEIVSRKESSAVEVFIVMSVPVTDEFKGTYDPWYGLTVPGENAGSSDGTLWANLDGFFLHDTCWQMLQLVHQTVGSSSLPLELRLVYLTMQARLKDDMETSIDWEDSRVYGGSENFQAQEWEAEPGFEVSLPK